MVQQVLADIYAKYGEEAVFNVKKLRALLLDMRIPKKTINLLSDISRIEYFKQFAIEIKSDSSAREKLIYNIENEFAFEKNAVEYGVDCWVYVFGGKSAGSLDERKPDSEIWPEEKAELVAAALRELMRDE